MRYTTTDAPLNGIQDDSLGDKMGIAVQDDSLGDKMGIAANIQNRRIFIHKNYNSIIKLNNINVYNIHKVELNIPLRYHWYITPVLILLALGLANTLYLAWSHYQNYTDLTFSSFCALSKAINCDTVSQSPWSILWSLPLSHWGFFAYALFLLIVLATLRLRDDTLQLWHLLFPLGLVYAAASLVFAYISASKIHAHCLLCLASHAITLALCFSAWIIRRRFSRDGLLVGLGKGIRFLWRSWPLRLGILALLVALVGLRLALPQYWHFTLPIANQTVATGLTEDGRPWIGAKNPKLTIHEYADYQCFQCGKMHQFLRQLINAHPDAIRLVHHHYPMDHEFNNVIVPEPFHVGSGKMAMIAIYAASKDKFWLMNDALYTMGRQKESFNTRTLAAITGFTAGELAAATQHPQIREVLLYQIRKGMKLRIGGTPTYVIEGKTYEGAIPANLLKQLSQ
jgi:uncharacterized membrane protein/protein-disulfide isomerase